MCRFRHEIEPELGSGDFSMVYLVLHRLRPDGLFALEQYIAPELVVRNSTGASLLPVKTEALDGFEDGLRRFRDEAEQLRRFRNKRHIGVCLNVRCHNLPAVLRSAAHTRVVPHGTARR